jgi:hypothetical protein
MNATTHPNGIAPTASGNYRLGAKGGRMAQAWQHIWNQLSRTEWKGSLELAQDAAREFNLKPITVSEMLCRMRASGVIEQEMIPVKTQYVRKGKPYESLRPRVHYRIAKRTDGVQQAIPYVHNGNYDAR